jgi:hypothetical protein
MTIPIDRDSREPGHLTRSSWRDCKAGRSLNLWRDKNHDIDVDPAGWIQWRTRANLAETNHRR